MMQQTEESVLGHPASVHKHNSSLYHMSDGMIWCREKVLYFVVFYVFITGPSDAIPHFPKDLPKDKSTRELVVMAMQAHIVCSQQR